MVTLLGGGDKISTLPKNGKGSFRLSMDVPQKKTRKFLDSYMGAFDPSNTTLSAVRLRAILDHWSDTHPWNVAFHTPSKKAVKKRLDVRGLDLGLVQRTTEDENRVRFSIIQSSNDDAFVDLEPGQSRTNPLLLIYGLNPDSVRGNKPKCRVFDKSVKQPPIGIGIILPNELIGDGGTMIARKKGEEE